MVVGLNFEFVCNEIGVGQLKHVHNVIELLNNFGLMIELMMGIIILWLLLWILALAWKIHNKINTTITETAVSKNIIKID